MLWHVFIDFIDVVQMVMYMTKYGLPCYTEYPVQQDVISRSATSVSYCKAAVGVFMVLSFFFHSQSFPSITLVLNSSTSTSAVQSAPQEPAQDMRTLSQYSEEEQFASHQDYWPSEDRDSLSFNQKQQIQSQGTSVTERTSISSTSGATVTAGKTSANDARLSQRPRQEHRVEVVKARKRSAIISLLLVDLPFLAIRSSMYVLQWSAEQGNAVTAEAALAAERVASQESQAVDLLLNANRSAVLLPATSLGGPGQGCSSNTTTTQGVYESMEPMMQTMILKNIFCILLQAMMLRFVQQADLERARKIKWMDVYKHNDFASRNVEMQKRRSQNRVLQQIWEDLDRAADKEANMDKLHQAYEDSGAYGEAFSEDSDAQSESDAEQRSLSDLDGQSSQRGRNLPKEQIARRQSICGNWSCCCRRQTSTHSSCWFFSCICKRMQLIMDVTMGFGLGWLLTQIPFAEMFSTLEKSSQKECST
jgi:hypothetical protein